MKNFGNCGDCKKITIAVFKSGKAIITGARSQTQLTTAYDFISKFIQQRFQTIKLNWHTLLRKP